jgi:hypothetical protein
VVVEHDDVRVVRVLLKDVLILTRSRRLMRMVILANINAILGSTTLWPGLWRLLGQTWAGLSMVHVADTTLLRSAPHEWQVLRIRWCGLLFPVIAARSLHVLAVVAICLAIRS